MAETLRFSKNMQLVMHQSFEFAHQLRHEFVTVEHILAALTAFPPFISAIEDVSGNHFEMLCTVSKHLSKLEKVPAGIDYEIEQSVQLKQLINTACNHCRASQAPTVGIDHIVGAIIGMEDCYSCQIIREFCGIESEADVAKLFRALIHFTRNEEEDDIDEDFEISKDDIDEMPLFSSLPFGNPMNTPKEDDSWREFVTCVNDNINNHNPLIGREAELERTVQVLCRKEKNNPIHIGDPGVGKTAIIYGLAKRIESGNVPERLKGYKIYQLDMGDLVAGTQYRGDLEKRLKTIMKGLIGLGNAIVYIDEIHNIVGAGATNNSSMDACNILKPYIENSDLRFIGTTTFDEYKRTLANSRGIVRHFQQIEINEPSVDEAIDILLGLRKKYEKFHGVKYHKDIITYAVKSSARYIQNRALPDKAIDLIDEAGAYHELHPDCGEKVSKETIAQVLAKICKVDHLAEVDTDADEQLDTLYSRINSKIYGQDEAIKNVVEAVQMSRAGLLDDNKPTASLLFVGPTGVGKTEVARVLASELGLNLLRFDMSEYAEKHTVAKLIGSPAGYVGYEDGGLLTDAIRKTPNCVLLLDEIEKAHSDIYNLLLQVMDYASLTDNKGQKADFRHVILIMTSNAGAQHASQASVGFTGSVRRGDTMMKAVKSTFKPEFLNRLSSTVVFNDLNRTMATLILEKKLRDLHSRLNARKVTLTLSSDASEWLLNKGFTPENGAREIDRVINQALKPLLMKEILFGSLKKGGNATVSVCDGSLSLQASKIKRTSKASV